jgi:transcriptional regulator with XRE-family HTH domain
MTSPNSPKLSLNELIGQRVRALRILHGHSQNELARILNLTFQQVQKYEKGQNKLSVENLWKIAKYYNVQIIYFLDDETVSVAADANADSNTRLRMEIARALPVIKHPDQLRALLELVRCIPAHDERSGHLAAA